MKIAQPGLSLWLFIAAIVNQSADAVSNCTFDTEPSGSYTNTLVPCELTFFQNDAIQSQNSSLTSCDALDPESSVLGSGSQHLTLWPDQCVSNLTRCYKIFNTDTVLRASLLNISNIPEHTTHIKIDCSADKVAPEAENLAGSDDEAR